MTVHTPPPQQPPGLHGPTLSAAEFTCIAEIAHREAGLDIPPGKAAMVRTRLARRLRALNLPGFAAYCALVTGPAGADERGTMISALTTNVSHFFREAHHFDLFREQLVPRLLDKAHANGRIRIWSAGCSNGQEPYSIAMTLHEAGVPADADLRILATDIDPQVVTHARAGGYPDNMMTGLPEDQRTAYFTMTGEGPDRQWQIRDEIARMVAFRELNLLRDWPMRGHFDAIFCRNVVIYFDADTQAELWPRFARALDPGGWLFLGHSERISASGLPFFDSRGMTSYQRNRHLTSPAQAPAKT